MACAVLLLCRGLPPRQDARLISWQLMRSATSAAANYRAACRCRSRREFIAKISLVIEECDETDFWLELLTDVALVTNSIVGGLRSECSELLAILTMARITARRRLKGPRQSRNP